MNAIILAGGKGKRLKILTKNHPKHFLTVLNKPLIFYILDDLTKSEVERVELSLNNKYNFFVKSISLSYKNKLTAISFKRDHCMLGPWLPVLNKLKTEKDTLIACAVDMHAKIDYKELLKLHKKQRKPVTIVVAKTYPTPKAMTFKIKGGLLNSCKRVEMSTANEYINIGVYVVNSELINYIPKDLGSFYEDDLFKIFVKERIAAAYIMPDKGFNINTPYNLLCANLYQLKTNHIKIASKSSIASCDIIPPVFVGEKVIIEKGSIIGPNVVIGDNMLIGENVKIKNSMILSGSKIGSSSNISYTLIGFDSDVPRESVLEATAFCRKTKEFFNINLSALKNELKK